MKVCPECAESVQDAARKCRFCDYRFEESADAAAAADAAPTTKKARSKSKRAAASAAAAAAEPAAPAVPAAVAEAAAAPAAAPAVVAAPAAARGPFVLVALGGASAAVAGVLMCIAAGSGAHLKYEMATAFGIAGALLALGWGALVPRGHAHPMAILGGIALAVGPIVAVNLEGGTQLNVMEKGFWMVGGILACLLMHMGTLESLLFDGTKLAALLAVVGLVGEALVKSVAKVSLPEWAGLILAWMGMVGVALFGVALAVAAGVRSQERT